LISVASEIRLNATRSVIALSRQRQQTHGAIHRRNDISQVLYIIGSDFGQVLDEAVGIRQQAVAAPQEAARTFGSFTTKLVLSECEGTEPHKGHKVRGGNGRPFFVSDYLTVTSAMKRFCRMW
jgi:hypothetical protein